MHRSACWAGYPSDSSRRLTAVGALHISSIATAQGPKDYDYADDGDCHHRHRVPAAAAVGPVPPCRAQARRSGMRRLGPAATHPRGVRALAPAADLGCSPACGRAAPQDHSGRPVGCTTTVTIVRAGARRALFAGGVTTLLPAAAPRGPCDHHPGGGRRSGRTLIAGVVISPCDGRGPRGLCDCLPGGGRRSGRTCSPEASLGRPPASRPGGTRDWRPGGGRCT